MPATDSPVAARCGHQCGGAVLLVSALFLLALQQFTIADTTCQGVLVRLVTRGSLHESDGLCRSGERVRLYWSLGIGALDVATVTAAFLAAARVARREADSP